MRKPRSSRALRGKIMGKVEQVQLVQEKLCNRNGKNLKIDVIQPPDAPVATCTSSAAEDIYNTSASNSASDASSLFDTSDLDVEVSDGDHFNDVNESDSDDYKNVSNEDESGKLKISFKRKRGKNIEEESEHSSDENQMEIKNILKTHKSCLSDTLYLQEENKQLRTLLLDAELKEQKANSSIHDLFTAVKDLVNEVKETKIEMANMRNEISIFKLNETSLQQKIETAVNTLSQQTTQLSTDLINTNQKISTLKEDMENLQKAIPCISVPETILSSDDIPAPPNVDSELQESGTAHCSTSIPPPLNTSLEMVNQERLPDPIVLSDTEEILSSEENQTHQRTPSPISISDESEDSDSSISQKSASMLSPRHNHSSSDSESSSSIEDISPVRIGGQPNSSIQKQNVLLRGSQTSASEKVSLTVKSSPLKLPESSELDKYIGEFVDFGSVRLSKQRLKGLSYEKVSVLVSELCVNVFTPTEMALSTLSGRRSNTHKNSIPKRRLDPDKVDGIADFIVRLTKPSNPIRVVGEVRQAIMVKLGKFLRTHEGKKIIADQQALLQEPAM
ncbi:uncharacterized protein LOC113213509 [Frankliniella occidentalis]|uniref:Uncharacterized protein LOC113213509 n=1 Tax=Frankliniella occidentalis TaxID=133901 RepID=A0A6J1T477_FRAOC|nr:uncharacterized protein LOC113213509 [Frankliniella occidentalis]